METRRNGKPSRPLEVSDLSQMPRDELLRLAFSRYRKIDRRRGDGTYGGIAWSFPLLLKGLVRQLPIPEEEEEPLAFARRLELHLFQVLGQVEKEATCFSICGFRDYIASLDAIELLRENSRAQLRLSVFESVFPLDVPKDYIQLWKQLKRERNVSRIEAKARSH